MVGLDTNVLARSYVEAQDDAPTQKQRERARALLESGKPLCVCKTVLLELEWVLRGHYDVKPAVVAQVFDHLLALPQLEVEDRVAVEQAVAQLRKGFDFADALHHASYRHCTQLATFDDKGFARRALKQGLKPAVTLL